MADDDHQERPDQPEMSGLDLDDLEALYEAEAAATDPVEREFNRIAVRLEYGDNAPPEAG